MENPKVAGSAAVDSTVVGEAGTLSADTLQKSGMPHQSDFSLLRVVFMVLILGAIGAAGWYLLIREGGPLALVPYTGRVLYQGKPVVGSVTTQNLDDLFDFAGGEIDADGRFSLSTNGEPGASMGRHKLAIISFERGAPPRPLVPAAYTNVATTPLVIEVTGDPAMNKGEFILEGSAPEPAAGRPAPDSSPSAPPSSPGPPSSPVPSDVSPPLVEPAKP